jgi:hypothetical protein
MMSGPQSLTIDGTWLHVEDGNHSVSASGIVYTVTALPQDGTLTVDGTTLGVNGHFTQQQIDDGLVVYTGNDASSFDDSFNFSTSDAASDDFGTGTLQLHSAGGIFWPAFTERTMTGGTNPVVFYSGTGFNTFSGGTDTTVSYALAPAGTEIVLSGGPTRNGFGENDTLVGIHKVIGSAFDDTIFSGTGTNLIYGGGGDDEILGFGGNDTAGYSGARSDYRVFETRTGGLQIVDLRAGSPDGTDTVESVQSFKFSDGTYTLAQIGVVQEIEARGDTALAIIDDTYAFLPNGGTSGPTMKYGGTPWTDGEWGNWTPLAAEKTATGYEIAFQLGAAGVYTVWNTDSNGNLTTDSIGTVTGGSQALQALETSFHQDLNGDGVIGLPASTLIESFGSSSLVQTGSNYFLDQGDSSTMLHYDGAAFTAGQWGGWTPIGVEATATGYEVAFKVNGTDQYTVWDTDTHGNITVDPIGTVSGSSAALAGLELSFHQDLNGDTMIGNPSIAITIESSGSTNLVLTNNEYFLDAHGTSNGPVLKYDAAPWTDGEWGNWTPVGAEATSSGHEVAFNLAGTNLYTVWNTDTNGNITNDTIGNLTANSSALEAVETSFHQDLNGDGIIGDPSIPFAIETSGLTSLTQIDDHFFLYDKGTSNGPDLKYGGTNWTAGDWGGWTPIAAETTGAAYDVAFKLAGSDLYTFWFTDANGNMTGNSLGSVSGSDLVLQSSETLFHQDLNGDGVIGLAAPITAPASGNAILTGTPAADAFVFNAQFGNDTVKSFQPDSDQVFVDHTLFASIADLFTHMADNAGGSAAVTIGANQSITFDSVSTLTLQQHANDFHLV